MPCPSNRRSRRCSTLSSRRVSSCPKRSRLRTRLWSLSPNSPTASAVSLQKEPQDCGLMRLLSMSQILRRLSVVALREAILLGARALLGAAGSLAPPPPGTVVQRWMATARQTAQSSRTATGGAPVVCRAWGFLPRTPPELQLHAPGSLRASRHPRLSSRMSNVQTLHVDSLHKSHMLFKASAGLAEPRISHYIAAVVAK